MTFPHFSQYPTHSHFTHYYIYFAFSHAPCTPTAHLLHTQPQILHCLFTLDVGLLLTYSCIHILHTTFLAMGFSIAVVLVTFITFFILVHYRYVAVAPCGNETRALLVYSGCCYTVGYTTPPRSTFGSRLRYYLPLAPVLARLVISHTPHHRAAYLGYRYIRVIQPATVDIWFDGSAAAHLTRYTAHSIPVPHLPLPGTALLTLPFLPAVVVLGLDSDSVLLRPTTVDVPRLSSLPAVDPTAVVPTDGCNTFCRPSWLRRYRLHNYLPLPFPCGFYTLPRYIGFVTGLARF